MECGKTVLREKKLGETVRNSKVQITIGFDVTPHILLHTYITNLILSGANVKVVQYLAGHSKAEITLNIYAHLVERSPEANLGTVLQAFPRTETAKKTSPKVSPNAPSAAFLALSTGGITQCGRAAKREKSRNLNRLRDFPWWTIQDLNL